MAGRYNFEGLSSRAELISDPRLSIDLDMGADFAELLTSAPEWVRRRVETLELVEPTRVRRKISVDFLQPRPRDIDGRPESGRPIHGVSFVPLMWLDKGPPLERLSVRDEHSRSVPVLNSDENGLLVTSAIVFAADEDCAAGRITSFVRDVIWRRADRIVFGTAIEAEREWDALEWEIGERALLSVLSTTTGWLMDAAATAYVLTARITGHRLDRRVLKVEYDSEQASDHFEDVGPGFVEQNISLESTGDEASYHAAIEAPASFEIVRLQGLHLTAEEMYAKEDAQDVDPGTPLGSRGHLYFGRLPRNTMAIANVRMSLDRSLVAAPGHVVLAASSVLMLTAASLISLPSVKPAMEGLVALLALLPAGVSAYLARPNEHPFVQTAAAVYRRYMAAFSVLATAGALLVATSTGDAMSATVLAVLGLAAFLLDEPFRQSWIASRRVVLLLRCVSGTAAVVALGGATYAQDRWHGGLDRLVGPMLACAALAAVLLLGATRYPWVVEKEVTE